MSDISPSSSQSSEAALHHREINGCEWVNEPGGRTCYWTAACVCGWTSEQRHNHQREGASRADMDYRAHVEAALGVQAYYEANVACRNCGSHHRQGVLVGTHVTSATCRQCGNRMLQPDNEVWDEARERSRNSGWF